MIGKITTGQSFNGLVNYLLDPIKAPEIVDTNLASTDRLTMIWELNACAHQRQSCKKPVKHISIAFAPQDGKQDYWTVKDVADQVRKELGYENNQFMVVRHDRYDSSHDRAHEHDHFHLLVNMIDFEGNRVHDSFDQKKLEKILREQELAHNLTVLPSSDQRRYKTPSTGQIQRMMREIEEYQTGKRNANPVVSYTAKIQSGIDLAAHDNPNLTVFLARLQQLEIDSKLRVEQGKVKGISYKLQDFKIRGCKLHLSSFPELVQYRIRYDPKKDALAIDQANQNQRITLNPELNINWNQTNIKNYVPRKVKLALDKTFDKSEYMQEISVNEPD